MRSKNFTWKKVIALSLTAAMLMASAGCAGSKSGQASKSDEHQIQLGINGYLYVPEYISLDNEGNYLSNISVQNEKMYYSTWNWDEETQTGGDMYYSRDLISGEEVPLAMPQTSAQSNITGMLLDKDGNMYFMLMDYSSQRVSEEGYSLPDYYLMKTDSQGNELYNLNITKDLSTAGQNIYIQNMVMDGEGHIYASADQNIFLFHADGTYQGVIETNDWISNMGIGKDGKVYITQWGNGAGMVLQELDFTAKTVGASYENFPNGYNSNGLYSGTEYDFIVNDGSRLYGYNKSTQSSEEILNWVDCDINGQYVEVAASLEDGRIFAVIRDWSAEQTVTEMALLTKTPVDQVNQKELIVFATLSSSQDIEASVVKFNKTNDTYRIKIKSYIDNQAQWTETTWSDAITAMNNDIISGNGPDIIDLSNLNIGSLVSNDALVDLNPYLEQSNVIKKADLVESVINSYTFDGVLTCIPMNFSVATVMGKTSLVGENMGWTLDDILALMDANPDASPFEYATKDFILQYCMMFNQSAFIDWENVDCSFDTEEFKKVLEFANRFPSEYDYNDERSTPKKIAEGDVLLNQTSIYDANDISIHLQFFGGEPVTYIGYPTVDGSVGCMLQGYGTYGISAQSEKKDGCWAFLESVLSISASSRNFYYMGFPVRKAELEKILDKASKPQYILDEKGQPMLDENGQPIEQGYGGMGFGDGTTIEGRALTESEVEQIKEVINVAKPVFENDQQIMSIITEEAAGYFQGQKSVDEVVGIIQSRVKMYISQNS